MAVPRETHNQSQLEATPLPESFDLRYEAMLRERPFRADYLGSEDPYTGRVLETEADYRRYLREFVCASLLDEMEQARSAQAEDAEAARLKNIQAAAALKSGRLRESAALIQCQEVEKNSSYARRKLHLSYLVVIAGMILMCVLAVPKLRRDSFGQGFAAGQSAAQHNPTSADADHRALPVEAFATELPQTVNDSSASDSTAAADSASQIYIGNRNSRRFHLPTCPGLPEEQNQILFQSREEALEEGYEPCKRCNP